MILHTDSSGVDVGAVLMQKLDKTPRAIAYHWHKLNDAEKRFSAHEQELMSFVEAARIRRHYLLVSYKTRADTAMSLRQARQKS